MISHSDKYKSIPSGINICSVLKEDINVINEELFNYIKQGRTLFSPRENNYRERNRISSDSVGLCIEKYTDKEMEWLYGLEPDFILTIPDQDTIRVLMPEYGRYFLSLIQHLRNYNLQVNESDKFIFLCEWKEYYNNIINPDVTTDSNSSLDMELFDEVSMIVPGDAILLPNLICNTEDMIMACFGGLTELTDINGSNQYLASSFRRDFFTLPFFADEMHISVNLITNHHDKSKFYHQAFTTESILHMPNPLARRWLW